MSAESACVPKIVVRGRSVMTLVVAPEWPLDEWLEALDDHMGSAAGLFRGRPVIASLAAAPEDGGGRRPVQDALDSLASRGLEVIGVDGIDAARLAGTRWARLPTIPPGRETPLQSVAASPPAPSSLLVDRPVRSGQTIVFDQGDVTVVGAIASGAEVVAGGSIHVYGPLRGRAIAGVAAAAQARGSGARIFCRRMEAELVSVDGLYRTAEHWGPDVHGRAAQVWRDRKTIKLSAIG